LIARKNAELTRLRADVPALVQALHQLTLENHQLVVEVDPYQVARC
jgi:hypothetical protein